jgi:hypothetical protein
MPLHLLLDENISYVIAEEVKRHHPEIVIESVHQWRDGKFLSQKDENLLLAAASEELTLVTYDQNTIPLIVSRLYEEGQHHAGVIFIDDHTVANDDFGLLIRSIVSFWKRFQSQDWQDRVQYLNRPPQE